MTTDLTSAVADALLALAALGGALAATRWAVPPRALAVLFGAMALGAGGRMLAPLAGGGPSAFVPPVAAVLAWVALLALGRRSAPRPAPLAGEAWLLDAALAACGDGVAIVTANDGGDGFHIAYSNPAFEHLTGYASDEAAGLSPSILVDEVDALDVIRRAVRGTEPVRVELPGRRKDGSRVWAEWQVVPVPGADGRPGHSVAVLRDVTERRRSERALRASEARFRDLFEQAADAILVVDRDGRVLDANRQACAALGYAHAELTALRASAIEADGPDADRGETLTAESTYRRKDGGTLAVEVRQAVIEAGGRRVSLSMFRDVTRRRRTEQALREREQLLRDVIAHIPGGVFWKDRGSVYLGCNDRVARDFGRRPEQVVGRTDADLARDPEQADRYADTDRQVMATGEPILDREEEHARPDGTRATVLTSKVPLRDAGGDVVGVIGVYTDITDRKRLEEELRQAQKMEAVGRLAGGVAHDFNNLLTVMRGNAELLRLPDGDDESAGLVADLLLAADRAAALVRQLLVFSRRQPARVEVFDLNEVVAAMSGLLRRVLGERIAIETAPVGAAATVRADRSHLEQVVMNLAVNARDAMPGGGTLAVRTAVVGREATGRPGRFVRLTVADTGCGMTAEVRARAFEPFFTTKGVDKGTGLGLATVFGIVQQAGGHIEVESAPGAGTAFRIDLPAHAGAASGLVPVLRPRSAPRPARAVSVLLVEDQDAVRKFARLALESQGHSVREADSGEAALALVDAGARFDLLVSDVLMPGIDGRELAARVRALRPGVGVVLMSGYAPELDHGEQLEQAILLRKPFAPADLFAALDKTLCRA